MDNTTFRLDPEALTTYRRIADSVAEQLRSAAVTAAGAVDPEQLLRDLGPVGQEFVAKFTAAVADHARALSTAGQLVAAYGTVLRGYGESVQAADADTAAAITRTGEELA